MRILTTYLPIFCLPLIFVISETQHSVEDSCLTRCLSYVPEPVSDDNPLAPCFQFRQQQAVTRGCLQGYTHGVKIGCVEGCRGGANSVCFDTVLHLSSSSQEALSSVCSPLQSLVPRPLVYDGCNHGFRMGLSSSCSSSHHWSITESARRETEAADQKAAAEARALEEMEANLQKAQQEMLEASRKFKEELQEQEAQARRKVEDSVRAAEALEKKKKGKTRGAGKNV